MFTPRSGCPQNRFWRFSHRPRPSPPQSPTRSSNTATDSIHADTLSSDSKTAVSVSLRNLVLPFRVRDRRSRRPRAGRRVNKVALCVMIDRIASADARARPSRGLAPRPKADQVRVLLASGTNVAVDRCCFTRRYDGRVIFCLAGVGVCLLLSGANMRVLSGQINRKALFVV